MDIEKLHGTDLGLPTRGTVGNEHSRTRYNNNYPFKTSVHHKWLVATEKGVVKGFMPIDIKSTGACIDNYYVSGGNSSLLSALIDFAKKNLQGNNLFLPFPHPRCRNLQNKRFYSFKRVEIVYKNGISSSL